MHVVACILLLVVLLPSNSECPHPLSVLGSRDTSQYARSSVVAVTPQTKNSSAKVCMQNRELPSEWSENAGAPPVRALLPECARATFQSLTCSLSSLPQQSLMKGD